MSLNRAFKVKMPESRCVITKPNKHGVRYVRYLTSSERMSSSYVRINRKTIGIYDESSDMLIPNNNYYDLFGESSLSAFIPKTIRNYGNYYLLYSLSSTSGLLDTIKETFPTNWDKILTIAMYLINENDAMYYIDDYCDENYVINDTYVTSQETSTIFSRITKDKQTNFFKSWLKMRKDNECIAYDITSISSYAKEIEMVDLGYNRDKENLPQINIGMFYGMNSGLPLLYDVYNGSIGDKIHFESMLKYAKSYKLDNVSLVMDRGFFKKDNLKYLYTNNIPFIMEVSLTIKEVREQLEKYKDEVKSFKYTLSDDLTNGMDTNINIDNNPYKLHLYFNQYKKADESLIIKDKIVKLENELKSQKIITEKAKYERFFKLNLKDSELISFARDINKIDDLLKLTGFYTILSSRFDNDCDEILSLYRKKDLVEKTFDNLKNYIDCYRLRVHYDETMNGKLFIVFISLILKSMIDNKIKNTTVKKVINELKKIKIQILANGEEYIAPLNKKQKEILKQFNIDENELKTSIGRLPL